MIMHTLHRRAYVTVLSFLLLLPLHLSFTPGLSASVTTEMQTIKGKVTGFANPAQSKSISLAVPDRGVMIFKYDDVTVFKNFKSITELKSSAAVIDYRTVGHEKIASVITKAYVKLPSGVTEIETPDVATLVQKGPDKGNYLLIDARPEKRYGEGHIPTALSIPTPTLKEAGASLLPADRDKPLIFYCGGPTCGLSPKAAGMAKQWGYTNVRVYVQGEPGWIKAGYVTFSTPGYIQSSNIVLIDLRPSEAVNREHIPGAVGIPSEKLLSYKDKFPRIKSAHIIFYSDNRNEIEQAVKTVSTWDYVKVTGFHGGLDAWKAAGFKTATGPAVSEIKYVRKLTPGEISIADFTKSLDADTIIIDVRTPEEYLHGHFQRAMNIPVDELPSRLSELSKDSLIITHCRTGVRAEMAYNILKEKDYNVRFLKARPEFKADGAYDIVEW